MSFTEFATNSPVITETNYDQVRIHAGEGAYTDTFNRGIVDSINRDAALETALTYMARSLPMFNTSNTLLYIPCDDGGYDAVNRGRDWYIANGNLESDLFVKDDEFEYACLPHTTIVNKLANITDFDNTFRTTEDNGGWTVVNNSGNTTTSGVKCATVTFDSADGLTISNLSRVSEPTGTVPADGYTVTVTSPKLTISALGFESTAVTKEISYSVSMYTSDDMRATNAKFEAIVSMFPSGNVSALPISETSSEVTYANGYDDRVSVLGVPVPSNATHYSVSVKVTYPNKISKQAFKVSDAMVILGDNNVSYTGTSRGAIYPVYNDVFSVSAANENNNFTVAAWCKFSSYEYSNKTSGDYGPLFIRVSPSSSVTTSVGIVQAHSSADSSFAFRVYLNKNGTKVYGNIVELPYELLGKYVFMAIRIRPDADYTLGDVVSDGTSMIVEASAVCDTDVYTSSISSADAPTVEDMSGAYSLIVGADVNANGTALRTSGVFDGRVAHIRVDKEWINNLELYVLSLSHRNGRYLKVDKEATYRDSRIGVNLIKNPTGHAGLKYWMAWFQNPTVAEQTPLSWGSSYLYFDIANTEKYPGRPASQNIPDNFGFFVDFADKIFGDCFVFSGTITRYQGQRIRTDSTLSNNCLIKVTPNKPYTLSWASYDDNASSSVYEKRIGLSWLEASGTYISDTSTRITLSDSAQYSSISGVAPSNATYAYVWCEIMCPVASEEVYVNRSVFAHLKLEEGAYPTAFSDDTSSNTAYRTNYHINEQDLVDIFGFDLHLRDE